MLTLYLAVSGLTAYYVLKLLLPELNKPLLTRDITIPPTTPSTDEKANRIEKLETLLAEKNKNILLLQTELKIFHTQIREFDKVKVLLEDEVLRVKEQNRIFRSELGLPVPPQAGPTAQIKENSIQ